MNTHLTISEIQEIQQLLQEDSEAQNALIILEKHHLLKIGVNVFCKYTENNP